MRIRTYKRIGRHTTVSYGPLTYLVIAIGYIIALPFLIPIWLIVALIKAIANSQRQHNQQARQQRRQRPAQKTIYQLAREKEAKQKRKSNTWWMDSPDGRQFWWDGTQWRLLSDNRKFWWDGQVWTPLPK